MRQSILFTTFELHVDIANWGEPERAPLLSCLRGGGGGGSTIVDGRRRPTTSQAHAMASTRTIVWAWLACYEWAGLYILYSMCTLRALRDLAGAETGTGRHIESGPPEEEGPNMTGCKGLNSGSPHPIGFLLCNDIHDHKLILLSSADEGCS